MCDLLNKEVEFFNPFGTDILKGIVTEQVSFSPDYFRIEIQHGKHHGEVWEVCEEDILNEWDDVETEERFLYFREED